MSLQLLASPLLSKVQEEAPWDYQKKRSGDPQTRPSSTAGSLLGAEGSAELGAPAAPPSHCSCCACAAVPTSARRRARGSITARLVLQGVQLHCIAVAFSVTLLKLMALEAELDF